MELSRRKQDILAAVVRDYVHTGEPVGSKVLCQALGGLSSATIRNEMSDLADMGYLAQPHTSAGRVPTLKAYRVYVDLFMQAAELPLSEQSAIAAALGSDGCDAERALHSAGRVLAAVTGCAALVTSQAALTERIHGAELIPMGSHTALVVLVTSSGSVSSRMCRFDRRLAPQSVEMFLQLSHRVLEGTELGAFTPAAVQTLIASLGVAGFELVPVLSALAELCEQCSRSRLSVYGQQNLLSYREISPARARQIYDLLGRSEEVISLLGRPTGSGGVIFGGETCFDALDGASLVVSPYRMSDGAINGYVGVVGPTRMNYDRVVPSIRLVAELLGGVNIN